MNETTISGSTTWAGLDVLDFIRLGPILDDLDFILSHLETTGRQYITKVFNRVGMEFTFVGLGV